MINIVASILSRCSTNVTNLRPTLLYNEGWMTRLLVATSINLKIRVQSVDFGGIQHWYSEGLLSSPFLARHRGDKLAEGFTHTDMAIGDFHVDSSNRGDIKVKGSRGLFGIIEAKMGSQLSPRTKNAPNYNQASRNLACIAFNTLKTKHDIFFAVAAPEKKMTEHDIRKLVNPQSMLNQIAERFEAYDKASDVYALKDQVLKRAGQCNCMVISYESWIAEFSCHVIQAQLNEFLHCCYKYNRIG